MEQVMAYGRDHLPMLGWGLGVAVFQAVVVGCIAGRHTFLDWVIFSVVTTLGLQLVFPEVPDREKDPQEHHDDGSCCVVPTSLGFTWMHGAIILALGCLLNITGVIGWIIGFTNWIVTPWMQRGFQFVVDSFTNSSVLAFLVGTFHAARNLVATGCGRFGEVVAYVSNIMGADVAEVTGATEIPESSEGNVSSDQVHWEVFDRVIHEMHLDHRN